MRDLVGELEARVRALRRGSFGPALLRTLQELGGCSLGPEDLDRLAPGSADAERLRLLARTARFGARLETQRLLDRASIYRLAAEALFPSPAIGGVVLLGFDDAPLVAADFLVALRKSHPFAVVPETGPLALAPRPRRAGARRGLARHRTSVRRQGGILESGRYNAAMIAAIELRRDEISRVCRTHRVRRLSLFGSATSGRFDPSRSDVDVLVEFEKMAPTEHAGHYFGLQEDLEALLQRPVDLVEPGPIRNPYFRQSIEASKVLLFEAA